MKKESLSVIITIILISSITVLLSTNLIRFSDISSAVAYVLVAGIIGVLVWGFKEKIDSQIKSSKNGEIVKHKKESKSDDEKNQEKIVRKTVKLHLEEYEEIKLNLRRDDQIKGEISSDGFFNFFVLTESSFKSFKNDHNFQALDGGENLSHFELDCPISRRGVYFLVIENADAKNIVVNLNLFLETS